MLITRTSTSRSGTEWPQIWNSACSTRSCNVPGQVCKRSDSPAIIWRQISWWWSVNPIGKEVIEWLAARVNGRLGRGGRRRIGFWCRVSYDTYDAKRVSYIVWYEYVYLEWLRNDCLPQLTKIMSRNLYFNLILSTEIITCRLYRADPRQRKSNIDFPAIFSLWSGTAWSLELRAVHGRRIHPTPNAR